MHSWHNSRNILQAGGQKFSCPSPGVLAERRAPRGRKAEKPKRVTAGGHAAGVALPGPAPPRLGPATARPRPPGRPYPRTGPGRLGSRTAQKGEEPTTPSSFLTCASSPPPPRLLRPPPARDPQTARDAEPSECSRRRWHPAPPQHERARPGPRPPPAAALCRAGERPPAPGRAVGASRGRESGAARRAAAQAPPSPERARIQPVPGKLL